MAPGPTGSRRCRFRPGSPDRSPQVKGIRQRPPVVRAVRAPGIRHFHPGGVSMPRSRTQAAPRIAGIELSPRGSIPTTPFSQEPRLNIQARRCSARLSTGGIVSGLRPSSTITFQVPQCFSVSSVVPSRCFHQVGKAFGWRKPWQNDGHDFENLFACDEDQHPRACPALPGRRRYARLNPGKTCLS